MKLVSNIGWLEIVNTRLAGNSGWLEDVNAMLHRGVYHTIGFNGEV